MEKNALIAIVLSILILILWERFLNNYYGPPKEEKPPQEVTTPQAPRPKPREEPRMGTPSTAEQQTQQAQRPVKEIRVETDHYIAVFTNQGARLKSFLLKQYRLSVDEDSPSFEMVSSSSGVPYPLGIQFREPVPFNDEGLVYDVKGGRLRLTGDAMGTLTFQGETPWGDTLIKRFTFTGSLYTIGLEVSTGGARWSTPPGLLLTTGETYQTATRDAVFEGLVALVGGKLIRESGEDLKEGKQINGQITWAGFGYTYFLFATVPDGEDQGTVGVKQAGPGLQINLGTQAPGGSAPKVGYTLFVGPKDVDALKALGKGLERSIDFGYFTFVAAPLLQVLRFSHRFTGSYGFDIILLTILIKLILAPLTHKSFVSMKQMQKLQPQMQRIRDRFKDDKEKMNREIMDLYKRNKVNPLGGCLPMLLQFPVFIGLYNALRTPIELRHASFLWIKDLSRPDYESLPFTFFDWKIGFPVLVLLMGASMFVQQWMSPSVGDPNQRRMMMMMPVVFTVLFVTFPAGLTIYWLVNNILTIGQQYLINRMTK